MRPRQAAIPVGPRQCCYSRLPCSRRTALKLIHRGIVLMLLAVAAAAGAPADEAGMLRLRDDVSLSSFAYDPEYWKEIKPTKQVTSRRAVAMFNSANMSRRNARCRLLRSPQRPSLSLFIRAWRASQSGSWQGCGANKALLDELS